MRAKRIQCDEGIVLGLGGIEQRPIIQVGPPALVNRGDAMAGQQRGEGTRQVAVEQDAHAWRYAAGVTSARLASSSTATAWSRDTAGNSSRN